MPSPAPPSVSPFAPGETDALLVECGPAIPAVPSGQPKVAIAPIPPPTATPPAGSGITVAAVEVAHSPVSGANTNLRITLSVAADAAPGDYPVSLRFVCTDGAVKPRAVIVPVR